MITNHSIFITDNYTPDLDVVNFHKSNFGIKYMNDDLDS